MKKSDADLAYLAKAGDTMTAGDLTLFRDPTQPKHSTTMQWVTGQINTKISGFATNASLGSYVLKSGDTMNGTLKLKGFTESINNVSGGAGTINLDLATGNTFPVTLGGNVTGFTTSNLPTESLSVTLFITQGTTPYTISWKIDGVTIKWPGGAAPTMTTNSGKTDVFSFTKIGLIWYGFNGGQNF